MKNHRMLALTLAVNIAILPCFGRIWTNSNGTTIDAEFAGLVDGKVKLVMTGKTYEVPLNSLSVEDQAFAQAQAAATADETSGDATPSAAATGLKFADQAIEVGKLNELVIPLSSENNQIAQKGGKGWRETFAQSYGNWMATMNAGHAVSEAKLLLGLPEGFNPDTKSWPIFIQWTTTDAKSNVGGGRGYWKSCNEKGWILISVDGHPDPKTTWSSPVFYANIKQVIENLHSTWPKSKAWPIAVGGFSGGSKISQWMAPLINELPDTDVRGIWLGGCNEAKFFEYAKSDLKVARSEFRDLKVYISTGKTDNLVNESYRKAVEDGCDDAGVKVVSSEVYDGGHQINAPQFMEALDWFLVSE